MSSRDVFQARFQKCSKSICCSVGPLLHYCRDALGINGGLNQNVGAIWNLTRCRCWHLVIKRVGEEKEVGDTNWLSELGFEIMFRAQNLNPSNNKSSKLRICPRSTSMHQYREWVVQRSIQRSGEFLRSVFRIILAFSVQFSIFINRTFNSAFSV